MYPSRGVLGVLASVCATSAVAVQTQFIDRSAGLGFAISSVQNQSSTDIYFQISAPTSAGWGAVGTGDRMDGSLMFIIYPSDSNGVDVSLRTTNGHNTPTVISGSEILVQSSQVLNGVMSTNVLCYNCTNWTGGKGLDIESTYQPWIWAIGPGQEQDPVSQGAGLQKHKKYGTFFVNMPKTLSATIVTPAVSGTSNVNTEALSGSVAILVLIHAICLGGAFVLLFPLGIVMLRWFNSVKIHWMLQVFAAFVCVVGLTLAIVFSTMDPEYKGLDEGHQIIGIVVIAALFLQAALGHVHHANYKKLGRRTWASHAHLWTGRVVIIVGMLNAILGFVLADNTAAAAAVGVVSVVILIGLVATTYFGARRSMSKITSEQRQFRPVPLSYYNSPHGGSEEALYVGGRQ